MWVTRGLIREYDTIRGSCQFSVLSCQLSVAIRFPPLTKGARGILKFLVVGDGLCLAVIARNEFCDEAIPVHGLFSRFIASCILN